MASVATPSPEAPAPVSSIGRIFGALFSPKATFESIAQRPTWLTPLVLLCLVSIGVVAVFSQRVGWRSFMQKQDEKISRIQQMPPEQRAQILEAQVKYAPIAGYAQAAVGPFAVAAVVAAIFLAVFNLLGGAKLNFAVSFGIVAHALMPGIIASLLGILIICLKDPSTVDLQNLVASNPGAFLSDNFSKPLAALLRSLDLFSFWIMLLLATGYSAANPRKISFGNALGSVFGVWLVFVLVRVGFAAIFS